MPSLSGSFSGTGQTSATLMLKPGQSATYSLATWTRTAGFVALQRMVSGGGAWETLATYTADLSTTYVRNDSGVENQFYRILCKTGDTLDYTLADVAGEAVKGTEKFDSTGAGLKSYIDDAGLLRAAGFKSIDGGFDTTNYVTAVSGAATSFTVAHSANAAGSDAYLIAQVAGTSAGDPALHLKITGGTSWHVGVDNSASDAFVIGAGVAVGTTGYFFISTAGAATIGATSTGQTHTVNGDIAFGATNAADVADIYRASSTGAISIQGDNTATPSAINIYASSHATLANIIRFITANNVVGSISATGGWTLGISGTSAEHIVHSAGIQVVGTASTTTLPIYRNVNTGGLRLMGGAGVGSPHIDMYGGSHATLAGIGRLNSNAGTRLQWDETGICFFGTTTVAKQAHIVDATDATDVITRANAILTALRNYGLLATS